jgi:hypothetical protein
VTGSKTLPRQRAGPALARRACADRKCPEKIRSAQISAPFATREAPRHNGEEQD